MGLAGDQSHRGSTPSPVLSWRWGRLCGPGKAEAIAHLVGEAALLGPYLAGLYASFSWLSARRPWARAGDSAEETGGPPAPSTQCCRRLEENTCRVLQLGSPRDGEAAESGWLLWGLWPTEQNVGKRRMRRTPVKDFTKDLRKRNDCLRLKRSGSTVLILREQCRYEYHNSLSVLTSVPRQLAFTCDTHFRDREPAYTRG